MIVWHCVECGREMGSEGDSYNETRHMEADELCMECCTNRESIEEDDHDNWEPIPEERTE